MTYTTQAMTDKVLVLGIDGFEPSLAKQFMDEGRMPALKQFVRRGAAREDLVLLGAMPTGDPADVDDFGYRRLSCNTWYHIFF